MFFLELTSPLDISASKVPGAPFAEYIKTGSLGRFLGFLSCLIQASFTIAGPSAFGFPRAEKLNDSLRS